jgi:hypothetical protein
VEEWPHHHDNRASLAGSILIEILEFEGLWRDDFEVSVAIAPDAFYAN